MTASLCAPIPSEFAEAEDFKKFFGNAGADYIFRKWGPGEQAAFRDPARSCDTNLFFGFFFDGTKNNYRNAMAGKDFSNIAHLYNCFPGQGIQNVLDASADWKHEPSQYEHFFKVYIPGVASQFSFVNDTGAGDDLTYGAAFGKFGERRIVWALVQAINNVHRYFCKKPLVGKVDLEDMYNRVVLNKNARRLMEDRNPLSKPIKNVTSVAPGHDLAATIYFQFLLQKLHSAVSQHWPDARTGKPKKTDPAIVKTIHVSVFGFSRGATQARVFANWFQSLCTLDSRMCGRKSGMSLGGFDVQIDFLGVFDTVASVGLGNTLGNSLLGRRLDGHSGWADSEDSLRVPPGVNCLHLVASHEVRRSFPLDSISVRGVMPAGCEEIVLPGAHSDVGGGYGPGEQGKGVDGNGADMMSRIPLLMMYKAARLNGVPLKLEHASREAKAGFKVAPQTITDFNAYIATCKEKQGPIHHIMREHARKYIEWRIFRRVTGKNSILKVASFSRATVLYKNDIHSAAVEFEEELKEFTNWLSEKGTKFVPRSQKAGFQNEEKAEWEEIARWWKNLATPMPVVIQFFDEYVHDSRASFKLDGADNEKDLRRDLGDWLKKKRFFENYSAANAGLGLPLFDGLDATKRKAADEYGKTGKIPRMINSGREPLGYPVFAGYLRFRKVYGGFDEVLLGSATDNVSRAQAAA
ncbi:phospholipase effector Tle1 domain-containing protein [Massilia sp. LjRoot122]|uniref:phospholipase effector Tle1 domain-containing protein n=1 Tax=Massilia sp. LjRoot122 TaxID=3342257 RepID=UPI003ECF265A